MSEKTLDERDVVAEAMSILSRHMEPAKVARFLAAVQWDGTDYVALREKLFADTSVDEIFQQISSIAKHNQ